MTKFRIVPITGYYSWKIQYLVREAGWLRDEVWEDAYYLGQFGTVLNRENDYRGIYQTRYKAEFDTESECETKILQFIESEKKERIRQTEIEVRQNKQKLRLQRIKPRIFP